MEDKKAKKLKTFTQKDIFPNMECINVIFEVRLTGKVIVLDKDNKIALVGASVNNIYTLPGGGINKNESIEDGIIREAKEETGCNIKIDRIMGVIDDFRNRDKKHCISHCAIARVFGEKGELYLTEEENKNGLHVIWLDKDEAYKTLEEEMNKVINGEIAYYNTAFNIIRDFEFVKKHLNK